MKNALQAALLSASLVAMVAVAATAGTASCAATATNTPLRTFQLAQKIDVVCMQVGQPDPQNPGNFVQAPPVPAPQEQCAPVPANVNGSLLPFHLFALVTQRARGEVAVVDLTAGSVVDVDRMTPGTNFIPVGALPTDIASSADGQMTFVAAAEVDKPAIYAIPSTSILGDSQSLPASQTAPKLTLTTLPSCALPDAPGSMVIIPRRPGGSGDAGPPGMGGMVGTVAGADYVLAVVLPGSAQTSAKVLTVDPMPLLRGGGVDAGVGPSIAPGSLAPCPILGAVDLGATAAAGLPPVVAGPPWDDGVKYVDGGVNLERLEPALASRCALGEGGGGDASSMMEGGNAPVALPSRAHPSFTVHDGHVLYVADSELGLIHVIDLSVPTAPVEQAPLRATSLTQPSRTVSVGQIALSPPTHDYQRFLYAIDEKDDPASLMVFDVTDPVTSPHVPLTRPHAELNPLQAPDRISFAAPVAAVSFVRHDFPITQTAAGPVSGAAASGLLCNPNPNAGSNQGPFADPGANYRASVANNPLAMGPQRLRGIFAFATLSNGTIVTIDVDDWDAPCRRPDPMQTDAGAPLAASDLAPPEPSPLNAQDIDPYHAPNATAAGANGVDPTTQEAYFPVSAPHRPRSFYALQTGLQNGAHLPALASPPQLFNTNQQLSVVGDNSSQNPVLLPTATVLSDPYAASQPNFATNPNVRFAYEDPTVQIDQDWTVTYEGALPTYAGLAASIASTEKPDAANRFSTLTLGFPGAHLCRRGVEDFDLGAARANQILAELKATRAGTGTAAGAAPALLDQRLVDYVQITDDLVPPTDSYWSEDNRTTDGGAPDNACWQIDPTMPPLTDPSARYNQCLQIFGVASDQNATRDLPILEAYDDHFVVGTFFTTAGAPGRQAASVARLEADPRHASAPTMKAVQCCFHNQAQFSVRAGGEWLAVGSASGLFHHVVAANSNGGRCVESCDSRERLANARSVGILPQSIDAKGNRVPFAFTPDRNSATAMRNPMFSYFVVAGFANPPPVMGMQPAPVENLLPRDATWKFSTRGQFVDLTINLAATTTAVSPQSMFFIDALGQLAIVDGSSQGLVLIDLNLLTIAHSYF